MSQPLCRFAPSLILLILLLAAFGAEPTRAAGDAGSAAAPSTAEAQADTDDAATRAERRRAAREARIQEYLKRREERLAQRQAESTSPERPAAEVAEPTAEPSADEAVAEAGRRAKPAKGARRPPREERITPLPRALAAAQASVRATRLGQEPTVALWLGRIDRQEASPQQLAAFGNFLSDNGLSREALEYYAVALRLEPRDSLLWTNAGTIHRQLGETSQALSAYGRALSLNPNNALAHYNTGAVLDDLGRYDAAVEAYKTALTLDPQLGDPAVNPQAANNERLIAVKLLLYRSQAGSLGLPLTEVPGGALGTEGTTPDR